MAAVAPRRRPADLRRLTGGVLVACGVLILSFATARYVHGAARADALRAEWEAARARASVQALRGGSGAALAAYGFEAGAPIARLRIPRLGVDEIVVEGIGDEELNVGPGHVPGTAFPGQRGNAVISAHRDRHFHALGGIAVGDTIVTDVGADRVQWIVIARRIVKAEEPALFAASEPTLTLTTCWPIRFFGPAPDRLIVTARPVAPNTSVERRQVAQ